MKMIKLHMKESWDWDHSDVTGARIRKFSVHKVVGSTQWPVHQLYSLEEVNEILKREDVELTITRAEN